MDVLYERESFERIRLGLLPRQMEDKWFAYYEEPWLHLHRSWTGFLIYRVRFESEGEGARAVALEVNQDPEQYTSQPLEGEVVKVERLVNELLAFNGVATTPLPSATADASELAFLQGWSEMGRAMLGEGPRPGYDPDPETHHGSGALSPDEYEARESERPDAKPGEDALLEDVTDQGGGVGVVPAPQPTRCPECDSEDLREMLHGLTAEPPAPETYGDGGDVRRDERWHCAGCGHEW